MIHTVPQPYASRPTVCPDEPHMRLMAAVLQTVVDDCRGGSSLRRAAGRRVTSPANERKAIRYMASTDRTWPFSFENLCEALGLDAEALREELDVTRSVGGRLLPRA